MARAVTTTHSNAKRAAVVADTLTGGGSVRTVAARHNVPKSTVQQWVATDAPQYDARAAMSARQQAHQAELEDLLLESVRAIAKALTTVAEGVGDSLRFGRASAADLGPLIDALARRQLAITNYLSPRAAEPRPFPTSETNGQQ